MVYDTLVHFRTQVNMNHFWPLSLHNFFFVITVFFPYVLLHSCGLLVSVLLCPFLVLVFLFVVCLLLSFLLGFVCFPFLSVCLFLFYVVCIVMLLVFLFTFLTPCFGFACVSIQNIQNIQYIQDLQYIQQIQF